MQRPEKQPGTENRPEGARACRHEVIQQIFCHDSPADQTLEPLLDRLERMPR